MKRSNRRLLLAGVLATSVVASACPPPWAFHDRHERRDGDHRDQHDNDRQERPGDRHERH